MEIIIYLPAKFEDNWRGEGGEQGQAQQRGEHDHEDEVELLVGVLTSAVKRSIGSTTGFHNHGKGPY